MKLTKKKSIRGNCTGATRDVGTRMEKPGLMGLAAVVVLLVLCLAAGRRVEAQAVTTTTVQGTVYLANGQPGAGTLEVSWPAFTTAAGQAVTAGQLTVTLGADGFMSVNLAPNLGATPAGLFYTAVYHLSDGTTSTEYWVVPAAAQAALGAVRAQVMPAAQAVQAVSKAYVDEALEALSGSWLSLTGGTMTGSLVLSADPTQPLQASTKHYVDQSITKAVPLAGGNMTGALSTPALNGIQSPAATSGQTTLQAAVNAAGTSGALLIPPTYAGNDTFTNANGIYVKDWRTSGAQQTERSVKEFGAVCDGVTDDTHALQTALNYANAYGVVLTIPQGVCKTQTLSWHGESLHGLGKQVSALKGFPGQDVLATPTDSTNILSYTRISDLTIYVDQSVDVSCSPAKGRASAGSCGVNRPIESNSIFAPGGNGLTGTAGTGAGWYVGNCAIAMPAASGAGGNGLKVASIENVEIAATGTDPLAGNYAGAYSTHTCGLYLAQWPRWSEFRTIDLRGVNTGVAMPALAGALPSGLDADSNRWENLTIQAAHGFAAAAGSNNILDNVVVHAGNSAATGETPTGLVLDLTGTNYGWTVRNAVVMPTWTAVQPALAVTAAGGAVTGVTLGAEHGLGFDPYGATAPVAFSGSCTAQATAAVNSDGSIGSVSVTQGGVGCSSTTTASINVAGTWDTAAPVNLIGGQNLSFVGGNLLKGNGGYTVWNASASQTSGTQYAGGGGVLPGGGTYGALAGSGQPGGALLVDQFPGADFGAKLQACVNAVNATYGGTCDARNFTGTQAMAATVTVSQSNTAVLLPCATLATASQLIVSAGARNVALKGCALRGGSQANGSLGGTTLAYTGSGAAVQVGDPLYAADTLGFHMDNVAINLTGASSATATGLMAYRTQEMDLESLYFLGNANQTGMTLDGTGNYTGGTYYDLAFNGFQIAVNAIGHQVTNPATTDWMNASTFVRLHVDCPTSGGSPLAGTYGINLQAGDGNTMTGGDVEGCATALHLGPNAKNNTIVGLRNENSTNQVVADAGSAYNNWMTGGTMFTGALTDNGTRNSFLDTFHRSFNGMSGDWYGSQQDATLTNHYRLGTGAGNERGLLDRYQTDYGYRWTIGLSDATAGEQFYQVLDELNSVYRISVGQYNNGQGSTNAQTVLNAAGTGAIVLNGSNNAGTGGVVIGSGGPSATTVATIDKQGDATFNGTLQVGGVTTFQATPTVRNGANAEIDLALWAGSTANQKESLIFKDNTGASQWYLVKDTANNLELNSAVGGLDSFKAYQSTNTGDTYVNASSSAGAVRINYEPGSGAAFNVYGGNNSAVYASFTGAAAIKFPGLAAASGHNCLQIDSSGYITNTGSGCGTNSTTGTTISSGSTGQVLYYTGNGTSVGGETTVPINAGGTAAATAAGALANLNGVSTALTATQAMAGNLQAPGLIPATTPYADLRAYGAVIDGATPIDTALASAVAAACTTSGMVLLPCAGAGCFLQNGATLATVNGGAACSNATVVQLQLEGRLILGSTFEVPDQVDLIGAGQGASQSYQMSGPVAQIQAPAVSGTMGTAVSATNTATTFTPSFANGSMANLLPGSAITIAGTTSCPISSIARAAGVVTATLSSTCTIPAGTVVTVAGVADGSFNTTPMVTSADYPAKTLSWQQSGASGTSSGGTVTGFNESTFETVRIQAVSGATATAVFTHAHGAADAWGMVALAPPTNSSLHHGYENISVTGNYGAGFWGEHVSAVSLKNMAFGESAAMTSIPVEMASSSLFRIARSTLLPTLGHSCTTNCGQQGYPYGFRCTGLSSAVNGNNDGCAAGTSVIDDNTVIGAGIKLDTNGVAQPLGGLTVRDVVIEQPILNALTEDISAASQALKPVTFDHVSLQDSFMGYGFSWVNYLYPAASNRNTNEFTASNLSGALTASIAGRYYSGRILVDGVDYAQGSLALPVGRTAPVGTIADGSITMTELDGVGGGLGPSLIPAATQSVTTNAGAWTCSNCTVKTGVLAPDGTTTAAEIDTTSGDGYTAVGGYTGTTAAGDCFIFGAWARAGQNQSVVSSDYGPMTLASAGSDVFDQGGSTASSAAFQQNVAGNWWHPIVALSCLTAGSGSAHAVSMRLYTGVGSGTTVGNQFWNPFVVYVPAAASVPRNEMERWRQQLMHGAVPAGMPSGGGMLAMSAAHKLYWGNDTNLYRSAAGVVKTDGTLDVGSGYMCQGSYGSAGQVLSTTGSGCQWKAAGAASFTGDGVVLGNSGSTGAVTAVLKAVSPNQFLAGPATGSTQATPIYRALISADLPVSIAANTSGTAAGLSAASVLLNGMAAVTQAAGDNSTKLATTAYTDSAVGVETTRAKVVEASLLATQATQAGGLPANGCSTTSGGNLTCNTVKVGQTLSGSSGTLSAALGAVPSGGTLILNGPVTVASSLATPANMKIEVENGGSINIASGATLTLNGPFDAGVYQIFTGSGAVSFGGGAVAEVYPEWWYTGSGAIDAAVEAAAVAAPHVPIQLTKSNYSVAALVLPKNTVLRGISSGSLAATGYQTILQHTPGTSGSTAIATDPNPADLTNGGIEISDVAIVADNGGNSGRGLEVTSCLGCKVENVSVQGPYTVESTHFDGLQDCLIDGLKIGNSYPTLKVPRGLHITNTVVSTSAVFSRLYISGAAAYSTTKGVDYGVVVDTNGSLGVVFDLPVLENMNRGGWDIHAHNVVDIFSPYTENIPNRSQVGTDAAVAIGVNLDDLGSVFYEPTNVNIYGGTIKGSPAGNNLAFNLNHIDNAQINGTEFQGMATFMNYVSGGSAYGNTIVSNVTDSGDVNNFGTVDVPQNVTLGPGVNLHTLPVASRYSGTGTDFPLTGLLGGETYWLTDDRMPVWYNGTTWVNAFGTAVTPEMVANGNFANGATNWNLGPGWSVGGGLATHMPGNSGNLSQNFTMQQGVTYSVSYTVSGMTQGVVSPAACNLANAPASTSNGTYSVQMQCVGTGGVYFSASYQFDGSLSNISVRQVSPSAYQPMCVHGGGQIGPCGSSDRATFAGVTISGTPAASTDADTVGARNAALGALQINAVSSPLVFSSGTLACPSCGGSATSSQGSMTSLNGVTVDGVSPTTLSYLDATSSIQTQLNGKQAALTNPVTGSGSSAAIGDMAGCENASCTVIGDIGAVPTLGSLGAAPLASPVFTGTVKLPDGTTIGASSWSLGAHFPTLPAANGGTGTTALTGLRFANGGNADTAATSAQMQSAIGAGVYDASGAAAARAATGSCASGQYATATTTSGVGCAQVNAGQLAAGALANGTTATTQTQGNNSANVATTAYVDTGLSTRANVVASADEMAQAANVSTSVLLANAPAGWYKADCYEVVTQAATSSSTMPGCYVLFNDEDTNVNAGGLSISGSNAGNAKGVTTSRGVMPIRVYGGSTISFMTSGYASAGATPMQYAVHVKLEYLGQ